MRQDDVTKGSFCQENSGSTRILRVQFGVPPNFVLPNAVVTGGGLVAAVKTLGMEESSVTLDSTRGDAGAT